MEERKLISIDHFFIDINFATYKAPFGYKTWGIEVSESEFKSIREFNPVESNRRDFNEQLYRSELESEFEDKEIAKDIINTYKQWVELEK